MTTDWRRYYFEDDEIKVETIDPRVVFYEEVANVSWNTTSRFVNEPLPPHVRYRDPQIRPTPIALAVKIALDGSVN